MSARDRQAARPDRAATQAAVRCPFCHSGDTEPLALFGSQLSTAQYYCRACHTPFEGLKAEARRRDPEPQGASG